MESEPTEPTPADLNLLPDEDKTPSPESLDFWEQSVGDHCELPADEIEAPPLEPPAPAVPIPAVVDVHDIDWMAVRSEVERGIRREEIEGSVTAMEALLERGDQLLFDSHRSDSNDRAIHVESLDNTADTWFIGDLHGDLLALEAALAITRFESSSSHLVFLGDLFDDAGFGLEVLVRVFDLIVAAPERTCVIAGNHEEALAFDGEKFTATVSPADFCDYLNEHLDDEWIRRAGIAAVRFSANAPRSIFLPEGLLVTHGGFPLIDLHGDLRANGDFNDVRCLADFTWTRAHPRARRKIPNRMSRGTQFGHEDFADFCALSAELERPVSAMVRGHDHVDERYEIPPAYAAHPILTTVALSRRLPRELLGPYERVPTIARHIPGSLPEVHRLHIPAELIREFYPEEVT